MRELHNCHGFLLLGGAFLLPGCGETSAAGQKAVPPAPAPASFVQSTGGSTATSVPGPALEAPPSVIEVGVEEVEEMTHGPDGGPLPGGRRLLGVKVRVTSHREKPRPLVSTNRFHLEADGSRIAARPGKDPPLTTSYLKDGESASGWIVFEAPAKASKLVLTSDLLMPPIRIPLPGSTGK